MVATTVEKKEAWTAKTSERIVASCTASFCQAETYHWSEKPSQIAMYLPALKE